MRQRLTSNLEDYLEMIYFLSWQGDTVHASQVADRLGVTRASVTGALRALAKRGYIVYKPYFPVELTPAGLVAAQDCAGRHQFLHTFFRDRLGIEDALAEEAACRMEHAVTPEVLARFAEFSRFLSDCRAVKLNWTAEGALNCAGAGRSECEECGQRDEDSPLPAGS